MHTGDQCRMQLLKDSGLPLPGAALARSPGVSRQVIVQDIALIRAENYSILSTNKGYIFRTESAHSMSSIRRRMCWTNS